MRNIEIYTGDTPSPENLVGSGQLDYLPDAGDGIVIADESYEVVSRRTRFDKADGQLSFRVNEVYVRLVK